MVSPSDFITQFYQPYFFYSLFFLMLSFICVEVFLKFDASLSVKSRSLLHLIPLFAPVFSLMFFQPKTQISMLPLPPHPILISANTSAGIILGAGKIPYFNVVSVTGLLCLGGVVAAAAYFAVTFVFGQRIAIRAFHVVMMSKDEYLPIQEKVKEIAHKMSVSPPKVGLIDDLRPNAFTLGYGRRAVVVFSLGILRILDTEEMGAVISHELAHVKARDYLFKSMSYSLNVLSFFNPLSYFAASSAQQERELLADEKGASLLRQPELMANVLTKIEQVLKGFPRERFADRLSASLFLVSPLARRPEILAAHPQIAHRVNNINVVASKPNQKTHRRVVTLLLMSILVSTAVLAGYAAVQAQTSFLQTNRVIIVHGNMVNTESTNQSPILTGPNLPPPIFLNPESIGFPLNSNDSVISNVQQWSIP